jgi:dihydrolipoamide dehydrogenase
VRATSEGTEFDVVVIGGGPGGYAAALYGASAGLSVAVVEKDKVGGTCLHRGCIPAKEFLETAAVMRTVGGAKEFGVQAGQPTVDFAVSQGRKQKVVEQLHKGLAGLMKGRGITTVEGTGTLRPGRRVGVVGTDGTETELVGRDVILAAGSLPRAIPGFEVDGRFVLTSDEVLALDTLPASVAVIGGGAIGCEFASMFSDLGTQVTVLEALPTLLPGCDEDVVGVVARSFRKRGIAVHTGASVHGHTPNGSGTTVSFGDGQSLAVDAVVVSVGRRPRSEGLLSEGSGVVVDDRGFVVVDDHMRAGEGIWAVGDIVDTPQLAHVGFA